MRPPKLPTVRSSLSLRGGPGERGRLLFLAALTLVFGGGFLFLRVQASRVDSTALTEELAPTPAYQQIKREPSVRIDPRILANIHDDDRNDRLIREPEPYAHLLGEARKLTPGDLEALGMRTLDPKQVLADPGSSRGHAFEVKGHLESTEAVEGSRYQEMRGTLVAADGQRYAFSVLRESSAAIGDVVRLQGFFFKRFAVEVEPGQYDENALYLIGRTLVRSYLAMEPVTDLAQAPLHLVRDFDLTDMVELQEDLLYHVLNFVKHLSRDELARLPYQDVEWAELRQDPDRWRGTPVRVFANYYPSLQWPRRLGPDGENPLEVPVFYDGIIKLPHDKLFRWIGFEQPDPNMLVDTRLVYLSGIFYKNFAWENGRGDVLTAPLIVATGFKPFVVGRNELVDYVGYGVAAVTAMLVLLIVLIAFADRRKAAQFRKEYLRRKQKSLARAMQSTTGEGTEAPVGADGDERPTG